jgi:hypothetical protein
VPEVELGADVNRRICVEKKSDAKLGAQERLEALLAATERPDTCLLTLTVPASQLELGQASGLVREVLTQAKGGRAAALREIANVIDRDWARLGTRSLILKTIRDRATALEEAADALRVFPTVADAVRDAVRELREEQSIGFESESDEKFAIGYLYKTIILALRGAP